MKTLYKALSLRDYIITVSMGTRFVTFHCYRREDRDFVIAKKIDSKNWYKDMNSIHNVSGILTSHELGVMELAFQGYSVDVKPAPKHAIYKKTA